MKQEQAYQDAALLLAHLEAGVRTEQQLQSIVDSLARSADSVAERRRLEGLSQALQSGQPLGPALSHWGALRSEAVTAWLDDARGRGQLAPVLEFLTKDLALVGHRRQQLRLHLLWPTALMLVATGVSLILAIHVMPDLVQVFESFGMALPGATTNFFAPVGDLPLPLTSLGLLLLTVFLVWLMLSRSDWPSRIFAWLRLDRGLWDSELQLRLLPLLAGGPPERALTMPALKYLAASLPRFKDQRRLQQTHERMEAGASLEQAARETGLVPQSLLVHLSLARKAGNVPLLQGLLDGQLTDRWAAGMAGFERRVSWLVYALVVAMVYQLLVAVYLPIFKMGQII